MVSRSVSPKWLLGLLLLALLVSLGRWFWAHSHATAARAPASGRSPAQGEPPGTALPAKLPLRPAGASSDNVHSVDIAASTGIDASDPMAAFNYIGAQSQKTAQEWLATLLDSDDYRARAAGLFLEGKINAGASSQPMTEQTRDALVQLAVGAGDPAVYAMTCRLRRQPWRCTFGDHRQISQRLGPTGSTMRRPWLLLAGKAHAARCRGRWTHSEHAARAHFRLLYLLDVRLR